MTGKWATASFYSLDLDLSSSSTASKCNSAFSTFQKDSFVSQLHILHYHFSLCKIMV